MVNNQKVYYRAIGISLALMLITAAIVFFAQSVPAAQTAITPQATTLKIIQDRETGSEALHNTIYIGEKIDWDVKLNSTYNGGSAIYGYTWTSSNTAVATVEDPGTITARGKGTATITCKYKKGSDTATARATIKVKQQATSVALSNSLVYMNIGDTFRPVASVSPNNVDDISSGIVWTSTNTSVATVDSLGQVSASGIGTAEITATFFNKGVLTNINSATTKDVAVQASCTLVVENFDFARVMLDKESPILHPADTLGINVVYTPGAIDWQVGNSDIISISASGINNTALMMVGKKVGDTTLIANSTYLGNPVQTIFNVKVRNYPPTKITLDKSDLELKVGSFAKVESTIYPKQANVWPVSYDSTDQSVATVDANGNITAIKSNTDKDTGEIISDCDIVASVEATDEYDNKLVYYAVCSLSISDVAPQSINFASDELTLLAKDSPYQLIWQVLPLNTTFKDVAFSTTDARIATILDTGVIIPLSYGNITITATSKYDNKVVATCNVKVLPAYSQDIVLGDADITMGIGELRHIDILAAPGYPRFSYKSFDDSIATVDINGYITAKRRGDVSIEISCFDETKKVEKKAVCNIKVIQYIERIDFDVYDLNLAHPSGSYQIKATIYPADADVQTLKWTSSNKVVATIDASASISAKGYGATTITAFATDGSNITRSMTVNIAIPVSGISITPELRGDVLYIDGAKRDSIVLSADIFTSNATFKKVNWQASSGAVALAISGQNNEFCKITAAKPSEEVIITATDERKDKSACVRLKVRTKPSAISISLEPKPGYVDAESIQLINTLPHTFKLNAEVFPLDAFDKQVVWKSENKAISVDGAGNVTVPKDVQAGTYAIWATTKDGSKTATKRIQLNQGIRQIIISNPKTNSSGGDNYIIEDCKIKLNVDIYPKNAFSKDLKISLIHPLCPYTNLPLELIDAIYDKSKQIITVTSYNNYDYPDYRPSTIIVESTDGGGVKASYQVRVYPEDD